jgi:hypothetical protein
VFVARRALLHRVARDSSYQLRLAAVRAFVAAATALNSHSTRPQRATAEHWHPRISRTYSADRYSLSADQFAIGILYCFAGAGAQCFYGLVSSFFRLGSLRDIVGQ